VAELGPDGPRRLTIAPNPSRGGPVRITFAGARSAGVTRVEILDLGGRRLRTLELDGSGAVLWDGCDDGGRPVRAGIHFVIPVGEGGRTGRAQRLVVVH
jgi:hypothetical protein